MGCLCSGKTKGMDIIMIQTLEENPAVVIVLLIVIVLLFGLRLVSRLVGGNANKSDRAYIIKSSFIPSPMAFFPGMITRMSDGMEAPVGTLRMTVGVPFAYMNNIPHSIDVKLLIIDEKKNVFQASKRLPVEKDAGFGVIDVPFPIMPYQEEFICRAWVVAAYNGDGSSWLNKNAPMYEKKNEKYIRRKLKKIGGQ